MTITADRAPGSAGGEPRRTVGAVPAQVADPIAAGDPPASGSAEVTFTPGDPVALPFESTDPAVVVADTSGLTSGTSSPAPPGEKPAREPDHAPERAPERAPELRPWLLVGQAAAAMAAAMGVGRFVYTPILPLMHDHAGLSRQMGANVATANYVGYFAGALITILLPELPRSKWGLRVSLIVMAASLGLMPAVHDTNWWISLRYVAGMMSAFVFVGAAGALFSALRVYGHHLVGWGFGGIGAGIALSGVVVLVLREAGTWQEAWYAAAGLVVLGLIGSWRLPMPGAPPPAPAGGSPRAMRWFVALATSYTLQGVGYIIAGTFLVAAINQNSPGWIGTGAWVVVGVAALPSAVLWAWLAHHWSRPALLLAALLIQVVGILLPVFSDSAAAAIVSAVLFGATFLGIAMMALAIGNHLQVPRGVAILTTGYSIGQMMGPLVVTPLLHNGYRNALIVSAGVVLASAVAAGALRLRFPHDLGPLPRSLRT